MRSFVIVVNDNGELKTITEQQMDDHFVEQDSNAMIDVNYAIDAMLDNMDKRNSRPIIDVTLPDSMQSLIGRVYKDFGTMVEAVRRKCDG